MNSLKPPADERSFDNDSPEIRARRLKRVRNMANLSREEMCNGEDINRYTLIGWENGRFGGLTVSGAEKIVAKIQKEGVYCTVAWLMNGKGPEPSVNPISLALESEAPDLSEEVTIAYELAFFRSKNANASYLIVDDDGMSPQFEEGDVVGGKKRIGKDIETTIGYDCIVETETGQILLRNVREGKYRQTYTLVCDNPAIKKRASIITDVKLVYSAPVVWHRKKDIPF